MQPFNAGCPHDGQRLREVSRSCWVQQEFAHGLQAQQRGAVRLQPLGEWALTLHRQLRASSPVPCAPSPEPAPQGLLWHLLLLQNSCIFPPCCLLNTLPCTAGSSTVSKLNAHNNNILNNIPSYEVYWSHPCQCFRDILISPKRSSFLNLSSSWILMVHV